MNQDHHEETSESQEFVDAPSDLISGVYEGGLKTWECSFDLVSYLETLKDMPKSVLEVTVLEIVTSDGTEDGL
jgi:protein-histidine N-methyltransferase